MRVSPIVKADPVVAAGIAVRAADTGRVLMLQRSNDESDPAAGTWEFPGGKLEDGEDPRAAAQREWEEEMGVPLPNGDHVSDWRSGVYQGFVHEIPSESDLKLNVDADDRQMTNPDDPDGDNAEVAAWWDPSQLPRNPALRSELRRYRVWARVSKDETGGAVSPEEAEAHLIAEREHVTAPETTIDETEAAELAQNRDPSTQSNAKIPDPPAEIPLEKTAAVRLRLHVAGVHKIGQRFRYRTETRDGHYVGMTDSTETRAEKGDLVVVEPRMFGSDAGAFTWSGATVTGRGSGTGMGRRTLDAFAGGQVAKDLDAGDGGNSIPASQDTPTTAGPTSRQVHVDSPLNNLSVFYGGRKRRVEKAGVADKMEQLIYGVVLEPLNVDDTQGDIITAKDIEKAAHRYLTKVALGRATVHRDQHGGAIFNVVNPKMVPVESFIAPVDFSYDGRSVIRKGSWVLVAHVPDASLWRQCLLGYREGAVPGAKSGWSVGATGRRRPLSQPV